MQPIHGGPTSEQSLSERRSCKMDPFDPKHLRDRWIKTMNFSGLDLNLLVAMDAIFAERSISRAGERLHLSQSATSGALARLREAFNDPLLVQIGRKMALTPLAEGLVEPVRDFLLQAEAILHKNPAFNPATSTRKFPRKSRLCQRCVRGQVTPIRKRRSGQRRSSRRPRRP